MPQRAIVFDLDDTLYLERDYVRSGFEAVGTWVMGRFGLEGIASACWAMFEEGRRGDVFDRLLEGRPELAKCIDISELVRIYREHEPQLALLPEAEVCLRRIESLGLPVGIITDGPSSVQRRKVESLGLERRASIVVITGEWGAEYSKPHPRAFEAVERHFRLEPERLVYVGDNLAKDFKAPRLAAGRR